jgi:hypothetical protein
MLPLLDGLLRVTREFLNKNVSRSGLDRSLRRPGVTRLADLPPPDPTPKRTVKTFKDCVPGLLHVDVPN